MDNQKKEVLETIHRTIRIHNYRLTEEEIEKADQEILPFLEENVFPNLKLSKVHIAGGIINIPPKILNPAVIRYYAIAQDNSVLLDHMINHGIYLEKFGNQLPLYVLDKTLTSQFSEREYLSYLERGHLAIKRFMDSLIRVKLEEREQAIRDFAEVVHEDPKLLDVGRANWDEESTYNLLTKHNFDLFGKEFFPKLTRHQRIIINSMYGRIEKEEADKLKELFQKYPNFHPILPFRADLLKYFSVDELGNMSEKDASLYITAIKTNCVSRMKELLQLDPNFECPDKFIREEIFRVLDNETILSLTSAGKEEISNIMIPESETVTFFPIKKIQVALIHDKLRQKKLEKTVHK